MNIKENIRKVLKEDEIKSLFRPITTIIEYFLSTDDVEKYVCDYKLEPGNFATKNTGEKYQKFKVTLYFKNLPKKNISWNSFTNPNFVGEKIMNELQDLILNAVGVYVDMYGSTSKNCKKIDESIIKEETELPLRIIRRFDFEELNDLVKNVKSKIKWYESSEDAMYDMVRQLISSKQFHDVDNATTDNEYWEAYLRYEQPLIKYVKEKLGYE